jgi:hypothetical protein
MGANVFPPLAVLLGRVTMDTAEAFNWPVPGKKFLYEACACGACWGAIGEDLDWYLAWVEEEGERRAPSEEEREIAEPYLKRLRRRER